MVRPLLFMRSTTEIASHVRMRESLREAHDDAIIGVREMRLDNDQVTIGALPRDLDPMISA